MVARFGPPWNDAEEILNRSGDGGQGVGLEFGQVDHQVRLPDWGADLEMFGQYPFREADLFHTGVVAEFDPGVFCRIGHPGCPVNPLQGSRGMGICPGRAFHQKGGSPAGFDSATHSGQEGWVGGDRFVRVGCLE